MTNSQTALTLKQEIEYIEGLAERFHQYDGCDGVEYGLSEKAMKVIGKLQEIIEMQQEALETISDGNDDGYVFDKSAEEGSDGECACHYADRILKKLNNFQESKCK
jgi:hypothetical protein